MSTCKMIRNKTSCIPSLNDSLKTEVEQTWLHGSFKRSSTSTGERTTTLGSRSVIPWWQQRSITLQKQDSRSSLHRPFLTSIFFSFLFWLNSRNGLCSGWMRNQERVKQTDNRWPKSQRPGNPKWHIWAPSKQQFRAATEEILTESDVCLYFWNSVLPIFCNIYFFCNSTNKTSPPNTLFFAKIHLKRGVVFYWSRC